MYVDAHIYIYTYILYIYILEEGPPLEQVIPGFIQGSVSLTLPADFNPELSGKQDGMLTNLPIHRSHYGCDAFINNLN